MSKPVTIGPGRDPWTVAVYGPKSADPVGSGVLIDQWRVLTCDHVVARWRDDPGGLSVAFRKANLVPTLRVPVARVSPATAEADVAVLELSAPVEVPPAPLLCPEPASLVGQSWWAFGFPTNYPQGNDAHGTVGAVLADGYVRLDAESRYMVGSGFSGTGLWLTEYRAVVGLVGQAQASGTHRGDAAAVALHRVDLALPEAKLSILAGWRVDDAGELAHAAWGWSLAEDPETDRHWNPRARGVTRRDERGHRFRGRRNALTRIRDWLAEPPRDQRVLVVTGSPGVGKSAVLGRVVTTADPRHRQLLPDDGEVMAPEGSVACAVHVKGKTALDVAEEIARAAALRLPDRVDAVAASLHRWLRDRPGRRCNLVFDALDEASTPDDTRRIIEELVLPIARTCAEVGAQVLLATRRYAPDGDDLLARLGGSADLIDLDSADYFHLADLVAYALATLQLRGAERPGNPYQDDAVAAPVAARIAELAHGNFLVAGLAARNHGWYDTEPVDPETLTFPDDVGHALRRYLDRLTASAAWALPALTVLAHAQPPGLTLRLWEVALAAVGPRAPAGELRQFATSSAANFLIESTSGAGEPAYRLFHQALNDTLLDTPQRDAEGRAITGALIEHGRRSGWVGVEDYLLRSLPVHAARAGLIDALLTDDRYLLHADLSRLIALAEQAHTYAGQDRARLVRLTPGAAGASPSERAELFSVTAAIEGLSPIAEDQPVRYRARWAAVDSHAEFAILEGHTGPVQALCLIAVNGRTLLATAGEDRTVRLWDPTTGQHQRTLNGHTDWVQAVCPITVNGHTLLATASADQTVRLWDPTTGQHQHTLKGHTGWVQAVCPITIDGRTLLATASNDKTIRLWDPTTGQHQHTLTGHTDWVTALCPITVNERTLLATAGEDRTIRLWDPTTGQHQHTLTGHTGPVQDVCPVTIDGRTLLATASDDQTVRLWDPTTGQHQRTLTGHTGPVQAVCPVTVNGHTLLATASNDRTVRLWDPTTGQHQHTLTGHTDWVQAVCPITADGRTLLATASNDQTVRLWDPTTGQHQHTLTGHTGPVQALCPITADGRTLLATTGDDKTIRLWDPAAGRPPARWRRLAARLQRRMNRHTDWVRAICPITVNGRTLLATTGNDKTVRLWDPTTGQHQHTLTGHTDWVRAVCPVTADGRTLLATTGDDKTVRLWDPTTGQHQHTLTGHAHWVRAICPITVNDRTLLATGSEDRTIRLWDPATGAPVATIKVHYEALSCAAIGADLVVGLRTGIVVITLTAQLIAGHR